jgi:hypothetical protein
MYFAPFDYINYKAKIIIIGITPGFSQMEIAIKYIKNNLSSNETYNNISKNVKEYAAFAGQMRTNLINMLDELELNKRLGIKSCSLLFQKEHIDLTHMTSLIRYPVFKNGKNYTGHSPEIMKSNMLKNIIEKLFVNEIRNINYSIIIPLGAAVSNVMKYISNKYDDIRDKCLFDFPHPSGANGHRLTIFNNLKHDYKKKINI